MRNWQTDNFEQLIRDGLAQRPSIRQKRRPVRWWLVVFALLSVLCLCSFFVKMGVEGVSNTAGWEDSVDQFMRAMRDGDVERAYAMFSMKAEETVAVRDLQELAAGSESVLFDGYRQLELESWEITRNLEGTFAAVEGSVVYSDGYTGRWTFTFIKEEEEWKVYNFYVWVPWEKFDASS